MPKIVLALITIVLVINVMILLSGPLRLPSSRLSSSEPSLKTLIRGRRAFDSYDFGRLERGDDGWFTQYLF
ncbi:hypothetical protein CRE_15313 [Caenorhabditis remanei]|uniref:Uncharacterized protein n=1 Tax=Caenorhabditis remanei TaxID=31234 RepID=E3MC57_CAERE|nr:hypothetical protein CRE_15313 [Caenorhabditis remanei]